MIKATIHQSLDPKWPKWGLQLPNRQMRWVDSRKTAVNLARRAGFRLVNIKTVFAPMGK